MNFLWSEAMIRAVLKRLYRKLLCHMMPSAAGIIHRPYRHHPMMELLENRLTPTANQNYASFLYANLLGRPGGSAGLAAVSAALDSGVSPQSVVLAMESSGEYINDLVTQAYATYLGRATD